MVSSQTDRINAVNTSAAIKVPCRVATTVDISATISAGGLPTIDGVALNANDRVLVWQQSNATQNGIYIASSTPWVYDADFSNNMNLVQGTLVMVAEGNSYANTLFQLTTVAPVVGTSSLVFATIAQFSLNPAKTNQALLGIMGAITPEMYGGYPNGVDCTAALQQATATAKTLGLQLVLSGMYTVSSTMNWDYGMTVRGFGAGEYPNGGGSTTPFCGLISTANPIASFSPFPGGILEDIVLQGAGASFTAANIAIYDQINYTSQIGLWVGRPFQEGIASTGTGGAMAATGSPVSKTLTGLGNASDLSVGMGLAAVGGIAPGSAVVSVNVGASSCVLNNYPTGTVTSATFKGGDFVGAGGSSQGMLRNVTIQNCSGWGFYGFMFQGISIVDRIIVNGCGQSSSWDRYHGSFCLAGGCLDMTIRGCHCVGQSNIGYRVGNVKSDTDALNRAYWGPNDIKFDKCMTEAYFTTSSLTTPLLADFPNGNVTFNDCELSSGGRVILGEPVPTTSVVQIRFSGTNFGGGVTDIYLGIGDFVFRDTVSGEGTTIIHYGSTVIISGDLATFKLSPEQSVTNFTIADDTVGIPCAFIDDSCFQPRCNFDLGASLATYAQSWTASGGTQSKTNNDEYSQSGSGGAASLYLDVAGLQPSTLYSVGFCLASSNSDSGSNHSFFIGKPSTAQTQIAKNLGPATLSGVETTAILQGYSDSSGNLRVGYACTSGAAAWTLIRPVIMVGAQSNFFGTFPTWGHSLQYWKTLTQGLLV